VSSEAAAVVTAIASVITVPREITQKLTCDKSLQEVDNSKSLKASSLREGHLIRSP